MNALLNITTLSTQAEGIARHEGKVIFVPFTLPGETWEVEVIERKKNFDRALPQQLIAAEGTPVSHRIPVRCPYYTACGGCQLQHIAYPHQLELKRQWLQETLGRVAHIEAVVNPVLSCNPWEYRNKVTFTLVPSSGAPAIALHTVYQPHQSIPVEDCVICAPAIRQVIAVLNKAIQQAPIRLNAYRSSHRPGSRLILFLEDDTVWLTWLEVKLERGFDTWFSQLQDRLQTGLPKVMLSLSRTEPLFKQVNHAVRENLYDWVCRLPFLGYQNLLDGYCGCGELTRKLSRLFQYTDGVEINPQAVASAQKTAGEEPLTQLRFHALPLETFFTQTRRRYDVIILNPPRSGLSKTLLDRLKRHHPKDLVMISCHPAALARDSRVLLDQGYRIESIQPFDMFPQTHHTETVVHYRFQGS